MRSHSLPAHQKNRQYANRIVVQHQVASQLSLPFADIDIKDPYDLLLLLLLHGKKIFQLIEAFISHYRLNYTKVTFAGI